MNLSPISLSGMPMPLPAGTPAPVSQGSGFSGMVDQVLGNAAQQHVEAQSAVRDLAMGTTDNLHGVLLQVAQADLSFRLILEIRNRLTEAYQEIMKMQV